MKLATICLAVMAAYAGSALADDEALADLSLEELVKTDITSVSRKSQSLADVPAAAFVISSDDIRRSGATALPDVLRMAPGIEVAQIDNGRYAVTARGFNGRFANKLQVLVDGRSIYHPVFSGVMWEMDPIPLEDIERIEIIRGPGAVMWGANAVNGVINIISKPARQQAGNAVSAGIGTRGAGTLYARHGETIGSDTAWKVSFQGRHIEPSDRLSDHRATNDRLENYTVDFRLDHDLGAGRDLTIWANASHASLADQWLAMPFIEPSISLGFRSFDLTQRLHNESLMGRYRWLGDTGIESSLQASASRSGIDISDFYNESRNTVDLDYQGRFAVGQHDLLWGGSHRTSQDNVDTNGIYVTMTPNRYTHSNTGLFVQDDWNLIPETLNLGMGARWDHTSRNGDNFSLNSSLLWTPSRTDSVWLKYARAPRTASRAEQDITVFAGAALMPAGYPGLPAGTPIFIRSAAGSSTLQAEHVEGGEIGYRKQISQNLNADVSFYRYRYRDLRSGVPEGLPSLNFYGPYPYLIQNIVVGNQMGGWLSGAELSADWMAMPNWRLQLSYTWSHVAMNRGNNMAVNEDAISIERAVARHRFSLRSQWNIDTHQQFDIWLRGSSGLDRLDAPWADRYTHVPGYLTMDVRYAYRVNKQLELAIIGRNLIGAQRAEYVSDYIPTIAHQIAPSGMVTARWTY